MIEKSQQVQTGVTCAKPLGGDQDLIGNLIAVLASPRNVT